MGSLRSSLLDRFGFAHAFATRVGGVSAAPFDTLNLGFRLGDHDDAVRENRSRFAASLGIPIARMFEQHQVHGTHVYAVSASDDVDRVQALEGDALVTRDSGFGVAVRTADCVPVLLAHPSSGNVASVHAGWRGAVANVVTNAIEALGRSPDELVVAIGPHIRRDAFEVGEEVAQQIDDAAPGGDAVDRSRHKPHGDLARLINHQLREAGVRDDRVDDVGGCTYRDAAQFFSHRREAGRTGRHLSAIVARDAGSPSGSP
ncbi:MAG: peptidoglycan editing factor PgeF [Myxococcota bacterium]